MDTEPEFQTGNTTANLFADMLTRPAKPVALVETQGIKLSAYQRFVQADFYQVIVTPVHMDAYSWDVSSRDTVIKDVAFDCPQYTFIIIKANLKDGTIKDVTREILECAVEKAEEHHGYVSGNLAKAAWQENISFREQDDAPSRDPNDEHRLTARELGVGAAA